MIKNIKYNLFYLLLPLLILGCGYSATEKDKYPELPIFPELTSSKLKLDSLDYSVNNLKYDANYYYAVCDNDGYRFFCIFDQHFKLIRKIENSSADFNVRENGDVYLYNSSEIYKYTFPWSEAKPVKILHGQAINDSIRLTIQKDPSNYLEEIDSIKQKRIDSLKLKVLDRRIDQDYLYCYLINNANILFIYKDKEYYLIDSDYYINFSKGKKINSFVDKNMIKTELNLKAFDKANLSNSSSGNHVAFSFHPSGYNYYQLKIGESLTKFKIYNDDLNHINLFQWKNPFNEKVLLHNDYGNATYIISLKK